MPRGDQTLKKIDLNLFLVFDTIYTERNLTQAARALSITQPAVSNALSRLRKMFNDELFIRTARGMLPTPVADGIAQNVSAALALLNASVLEREDFHPASAERTYQFSMTDLTEVVLLPMLLPFLGEQAPNVSIQSNYVKRNELVRHLSRSELDFAIEVPVVEDPQLCHESLIQTEYVCLLRAGHPALQSPLDLAQYLALSHIHVSSRRKGLGLVDLALIKLGYERQVRMRVQHYRAAANVASKTDLALTAPRVLADQYDLVMRPLPFAVASLDLHLYWHKQADSDESHRWMRAVLTEMFRKLQASDQLI
ncbi:MAG: LysR substrate-binding domain-containing protein [Pseudomonadales bacterium]|nr:LysR substrate-binding domain-containing protein [Pseudomonadales bacterium]